MSMHAKNKRNKKKINSISPYFAHFRQICCHQRIYQRNLGGRGWGRTGCMQKFPLPIAQPIWKGDLTFKYIFELINGHPWTYYIHVALTAKSCPTQSQISFYNLKVTWSHWQMVKDFKLFRCTKYIVGDHISHKPKNNQHYKRLWWTGSPNRPLKMPALTALNRG